MPISVRSSCKIAPLPLQLPVGQSTQEDTDWPEVPPSPRHRYRLPWKSITKFVLKRTPTQENALQLHDPALRAARASEFGSISSSSSFPRTGNHRVKPFALHAPCQALGEPSCIFENRPVFRSKLISWSPAVTLRRSSSHLTFGADYLAACLAAETEEDSQGNSAVNNNLCTADCPTFELLHKTLDRAHSCGAESTSSEEGPVSPSLGPQTHLQPAWTAAPSQGPRLSPLECSTGVQTAGARAR
eukprot:GGOE01034142.1.p1 GENE.GGOE01034142.1~~GGOE01034142.1.p1  ORF type:complete len:244 (-),score=29.63 GGOE01034142.1:1291-2022(-)